MPPGLSSGILATVAACWPQPTTSTAGPARPVAIARAPRHDAVPGTAPAQSGLRGDAASHYGGGTGAALDSFEYHEPVSNWVRFAVLTDLPARAGKPKP